MRDAATQRQIDAATPDRSTWLSANAGSGKTKVLTDRVARLLLAGTDPQHILCLTYTKAAASEMQNRLFKRLGTWSMLPDDTLRTELQLLGLDKDITASVLSNARRLFAMAIETPGGLKIQTIHSFCSSLLRRFPLEAGVTPQFIEMEDRAAALLRAEVIEQIALGPDASCLQDLVRHYTGDSLENLTQEIVRHRDSFDANLTEHQVETVLGLSHGAILEHLTKRVLLGDEDDLLRAMAEAMAHSSKPTDHKNAQKCLDILPLSGAKLPDLEQLFLTGAGAKLPFSAKIGSIPTKEVQGNNPDLVARLNAFMERIEAARDSRLALASKQASMALHRFAKTFLPAYAAAKTQRGFLDFDDLILLARGLLTDQRVADWVLYKLDGGIDHILVDEAQDTSPVQWQLIERLAQEFSSGSSARDDVIRTIFVVGDKKQSIYSFQGADPREFDRMKSDFGTRLSAAGHALQDMEMEFSFRSAATILNLVDAVFRDHEDSGFSQREPHRAFKSNMPGRVDLWAPVDKEDKPETPPWYSPVDIRAPGNPTTQLADHIAETIHEMLGTPLPSEDGQTARPITEGDILILVQRRSAIFHEIIRACKQRKLAVAGADRLRVGAELAVRDITALLSFLATPEDDLSLATALRSPLFGWDEQALFNLAYDRKQKYLWAELRDRAKEYPETMAVLDDLRKTADFLRPYDMIERILTRHHGRANLFARLGPEAEDGIDALLSQAMAYERNAVDSLTGFLVWIETDELEIKRQPESAGNRIRVMTAHAAKGLESPIVILPDCAKRDIRMDHKIALVDNLPIWRPIKADMPAALRDNDEAARRALMAERDRLLYVAMTRAEQWLIVAAAGDLDKTGQDWYGKVRNGMIVSNAGEFVSPTGQGLRLEDGNWTQPATGGSTEDNPTKVAMPTFFDTPAPEPERPAPTLAPSDLGGAKALPGEAGLDEAAAKRRGRQIHRLLEVLPQVTPTQYADVATDLLTHGPDAAEEEELAFLLAEANAVLSKPGLAPLFAPEALAEVSITANIEDLDGRRIHGTIDRLVIETERVLAVDFKSNAIIPDTPQDCPDALLRQMGAYAHALKQIYPNHRVETAILWTRNATLMALPHDLVTKTLQNTQIS